MSRPDPRMKPWLKFCAFGARYCASCLCAFALWSFWLALALLLLLQASLLTSRELAVPDFLLRRFETQLATSGFRVTFGRTLFDPRGQVFIEDLRLFLPTFPEPVFIARALLVHFDPRLLIVGVFDPVEIRVQQAAALIPAQLSPSGRPEEIIRGLEATLVPLRHELQLRQVSAQLGNAVISLRGSVTLPRRGEAPLDLSINEYFARQFSSLCREALALEARLAQCEQPSVDLVLTPSNPGPPILTVAATARQVRLDAPAPAEIDSFVGTTRLRLTPREQPAQFRLSASAVRLASGAVARGVAAQLASRLATPDQPVRLLGVTLTADALALEGVEARALSARLNPQALPRLEADLTARILEAPIAVRAEADLRAGSARLRFAGDISPRVLDVISRRVGVDVRHYYDFEALRAEAGEARFAAGWKFQHLSARVEVPRMNSYGVTMEDGRAWVELVPGRFHSPEAFARVGDNYARGTYEHDLRTQQYRFLLDGRLQPLAISHWFGSWWPDFFRQLEFPAAAPEASVEIAGFWRQGRRTQLFLFAETPKLRVRGAELDRTYTRMFIRPGFIDALDLRTTRGDREARGSFTYRADATNTWTSLDFDFSSTFELGLAAQLLGPTVARSLEPFRVASAPEVKARGTFFRTPAAPDTENSLHLDVRTNGEFRFHDFPLQDASFVAHLQGSDVTVERFHASLANGRASGNARVWGEGAARRLGFNATLEDANLGQAATTLQTFLARRRGEPPHPPDKFVRERADLRLNIAASAEGAYDNPLGFRGDGNATLQGPALGEVPLLGLLSELFTFTSLRFTEARGNFKIDGPKLLFPKIEVRGANSAIDAQGDFALDRRLLNFTAKVFPFQESDNVIKSVVGAVLTPLSNVLEVKLTGTMEKPQWSFVMGPRNLLRALAGSATDSKTPATPTPTTPAPSQSTPPSSPPLPAREPVQPSPALPAPSPPAGGAPPGPSAPLPNTPAPPPPAKP